MFYNINEDLKSDRECILAVGTRSGWVLEFAAENLKADRDIVVIERSS